MQSLSLLNAVVMDGCDACSAPDKLERHRPTTIHIAEEDEEPFTPDDPAIVREQNLRALLVLLPAKIMKGVVKVAMEGAMLHTQRIATAEAERRRRSLLSSRAQFRHTMTKPRRVGASFELCIQEYLSYT